MSYEINPSILEQMFKNRKEYGGGGNNYFKPKSGITRIRFCGPWNATCNTPVRFILNHGSYTVSLKDSAGNNRQPLCLKYVFENVAIAQALKAKGKVTQDEYQKFTQFGCLGCRLKDLLAQSDPKKKFLKAGYMWNVIDRTDGKCYIWTSSGQIFEAIKPLYDMYPKLFDTQVGYDFNLTATGEDKTRRYSVSPIVSPCPQGNAQLHDLDQAMADGYKTFPEMIELINNTWPAALPLLGISPNMMNSQNVQQNPFQPTDEVPF